MPVARRCGRQAIGIIHRTPASPGRIAQCSGERDPSTTPQILLFPLRGTSMSPTVTEMLASTSSAPMARCYSLGVSQEMDRASLTVGTAYGSRTEGFLSLTEITIE